MSIVPQPAPRLYQPTAVEIVKVAESAKRRHPECASRIDKAASILTGGLQLEPVAWEVRNVVRWHVASQSHGGAYIVVGLACPCQDSRAPMVCNGRFCKHAIAVALYMKILRNHVNANIRRREIDLGILVNGEFHAYADKGRMGYVQMARLACKACSLQDRPVRKRSECGTTYTFVNAASAVHYSLWLAKREQRPIVLPGHVEHSAPVALAA
jgi:hypothetical protein